ncbi:hypothetical protein EMIHUDRAFT_256815 [Emiliania huxleyi CCMP1516]|uniref:SET domain-containing protein n=2 Tax=Emiliania huxleyi TaxID=2903 RepID=A0A0D3IQ82_EMIH1|nr:hypothetical protein EMIHUDRAFT_256815 [Emiliania huxleyi CCMP1516]EOD13417.1 hypothetical protein EMIHUDRAFT_256815 [Emiliania huxleyi CCMP1516]|eukprot:XP_005765846.1 hypothetical protein EMIHUDRAFT_256815 [Emiliania huxleyi CCMP1516]
MGTPLTRDVEQVLDLANHASVGATARLQQEGGAVRLVANYALERGDEVSLCYDADADHLDLFERYGFFDATSVVHTAEAARGYDDELEAWWVPDVGLESSPLYLALRATLAELEGHLAADAADPADALRQPIAREAAVRERLASLFERHLRGYACSAEQAARGLQGGLLSAAEEAATRLVHFEQHLLLAHLRSLPHHSRRHGDGNRELTQSELTQSRPYHYAREREGLEGRKKAQERFACGAPARPWTRLHRRLLADGWQQLGD